MINMKEYLWLGLIFVAALILIMIMILVKRRRFQIVRIQNMEPEEKDRLLDSLLSPFGYFYHKEQDLVLTRIDAWQREFGYEALYDKTAATGGMIFQCFPVYFDYMGKTWLLEFWKGQYGIACGCEVGLYHAEELVDSAKYAGTHFESVRNEEMPLFTIILEGKETEGFAYRMRHWWLGAFRVGTFCRPEQLRVSYQIRFYDPCLMEAVLQGFRRSGYPEEQITVLRNTIVIYQHKENALRMGILRRLYSKWVLWKNHCLVRLFRWYTKPFTSQQDRILYIYLKTPFFFRRILYHTMRGGKCRHGVPKKTGSCI